MSVLHQTSSVLSFSALSLWTYLINTLLSFIVSVASISSPAVFVQHVVCGKPCVPMIETLSLVQKAHLSNTCLPADAVARSAEERMSCWLPYWVAHLFVRVLWPLTPAATYCLSRCCLLTWVWTPWRHSRPHTDDAGGITRHGSITSTVVL